MLTFEQETAYYPVHYLIVDATIYRQTHTHTHTTKHFTCTGYTDAP